MQPGQKPKATSAKRFKYFRGASRQAIIQHRWNFKGSAWHETQIGIDMQPCHKQPKPPPFELLLNANKVSGDYRGSNRSALYKTGCYCSEAAVERRRAASSHVLASTPAYSQGIPSLS